MPFQADSSAYFPCPNGWHRLASSQAGPQPIDGFLQIALGICDALIPLQRTEGCYGQLNPHTICIRTQASQVGLVPADNATFQAPHGLYGRARERASLAAALARVEGQGTSELVVLSGPAGVGKSALVEELEREVLAHGGTLVAGKFDQDRRQAPFSAASGALSQLVDAVLANDDAALRDYRARLLAALDGNGALLFDILPGLRVVLGDQPAPPVLPAREARRRFFTALRAFVATFARAAIRSSCFSTTCNGPTPTRWLSWPSCWSIHARPTCSSSAPVATSAWRPDIHWRKL